MTLKPSHGALWVLDKIFDYLDIEDMDIVSTGWKLFLYVASLDRILEKYQVTPSYSSKKIIEEFEDELDTCWIDNQDTRYTILVNL